MTNKRDASRLLNEAHDIATGFHEAGIIDLKTMREFDALCLPPTPELSATKIKKIRRSAGVSQAIFAKMINVSLAAIKQWERGERKPSGAALKILNLIDQKGLSIIL